MKVRIHNPQRVPGRTTKSPVTLALIATLSAAFVGVTAAPALATYRPPHISLLCTASANGGTLEGTVCVLPFGVTTPPNNYSATIAVSNAGAGDTFAVVAGSLPPGLTMPAESGPGTSITGNPTQTGTSNFSIKAKSPTGLTATLAYQITITVQGPPDQLLCDPADNGAFLINGVCVLPDATVGQPYQGRLPTSHHAGGTLSIVSGALPAGLFLAPTFGPSGDSVTGSPSAQTASTFTVQGTGDQGQPLYQEYQINVGPDQPLTITLPAEGSALGPGMVGGAFAQDFFLGGGAAPYAWSVAAGQLPPGLSLQTFAGPRDANDELAGTPTTAGTFDFTMRVSDFDGQQATQSFSLTVYPALQITSSTLVNATVGAPYSQDLKATGGVPPYSWFIFTTGELPAGLYLGTTSPGFNNVLMGTPTQAGTFTFAMQVQDSNDDTTSATLTLTIKP
jgi:large repetitive protein